MEREPNWKVLLISGSSGTGKTTVAQVIVITHHIVVAGAGPVILEGDSILPRIATQRRFPELRYFFTGQVFTNEIQSVFLHEPDEAAILANMYERGRGFADLTTIEQQTAARASWLHGHWLREQCTEHRVPIISTRPRDTLTEHVLQMIREGYSRRSVR